MSANDGQTGSKSVVGARAKVMFVAHGPDIVVAAPGEWAHLVVEAKLTSRDSSEEIDQLKRYMIRMRVPAGVLATGARISVLRDTFGSYSPESIVVVGAVQTDSIPELQPFATGLRTDPVEFHQSVLAAVLGRAQEIRETQTGARISFCQIDGDLIPWDKQGTRRQPLLTYYDARGVWVYPDFDLAADGPPEGWPATPVAST